jgi:hypothetical protein
LFRLPWRLIYSPIGWWSCLSVCETRVWERDKAGGGQVPGTTRTSWLQVHSPLSKQQQPQWVKESYM